MTITATIARGIKVDTNVTLDIVRYCKHEYAPGKICGRLEDHEIHNMLMPTPDFLWTSLFGHHEFEPDIPWDWDGRSLVDGSYARDETGRPLTAGEVLRMGGSVCLEAEEEE